MLQHESYSHHNNMHQVYQVPPHFENYVLWMEWNPHWELKFQGGKRKMEQFGQVLDEIFIETTCHQVHQEFKQHTHRHLLGHHHDGCSISHT